MEIPTGSEAWAVGSRVSASLIRVGGPVTKGNTLPDVPDPDEVSQAEAKALHEEDAE